ncbi:MAG: hypothetical protein EOO55_02830, partial [Hymenobacter sp.]
PHPRSVKKQSVPALTPDGRLSSSVKKAILLNNLYGVDLDAQAVEVTKLSLLLKCLEGETPASIQHALGLERVLPTIDHNIRVGNSLVETDFYDGELDFAPGAEKAVKPFSWHDEFTAVFQQQGGFDVVLGNPPYVLLEDIFRDETLLRYFRTHFAIASYKVDLYHLFFQKGIALLNETGTLGFITPSNYLTNNSLVGLRHFMLTKTVIKEINIITGQVFEGASVDTTITLLTRNKTWTESLLKHSTWQGGLLEETAASLLDTKAIEATADKLLNSTNQIVFNKAMTPLSDHFLVKFGMQLRDRKAYIGDVITATDKKLITPYHKPCYTGKDFNRYETHYNGLLAYCNREAKRGGCWDESIHTAAPKILIRQIGKVPICSIDEQGYHCLNTLFMVVPKAETSLSPYFLLGLLNSRLMGNYWSQTFYDMRTTFPKIKGSYLELLPIPQLDLAKPHDRKQHDAVVALVEQLLAGYAALRSITLTSAQEQAQSRLRHLERRLDALVYTLYGLTEAEIAHVATKAS